LEVAGLDPTHVIKTSVGNNLATLFFCTIVYRKSFSPFFDGHVVIATVLPQLVRDHCINLCPLVVLNRGFSLMKK